MMLITVIAAVTIYLLRYISRGQIGDRIVQFLIRTFYLDHSDAQVIYQYVIRNNMDMLLLVVILAFFLVLFRFFISWFTKYFDEISSGMDHLVEESEETISLPRNGLYGKPTEHHKE